MTKITNKLINKKKRNRVNDMRKKRRGRKEEHTENSGFAGIVKAKNEDSSFLVTEKGGK